MVTFVVLEGFFFFNLNFKSMQKTKKRHTFEINMGRTEKLEAKDIDSIPPSDDGFY